jgi:peptidoglycan/LPS O-acetylase OafA/YrhL
MTDPAPATGRIPSLDGWRAIAILLVLGSHFTFTGSFPDAYGSWCALLFDGPLGVRIFFVLSGFLISLLLLKESEKNGTISLRRFYLRRAFRIFPIYFAYLAVLACLAFFGLYSDSSSSWLGCLTFTRNMVGRGQSATVHFWSLAVEEQFYLLWPVLVGTFSLWRNRTLYFCMLLVPIVVCPVIRCSFISENLNASFADRILGPHSILVFADSLATGCLGAWLVWKSSPNWKWRSIHTIMLLASVAVLVVGHLLGANGREGIMNGVIPALQAWAILGCIVLGTHEFFPGYRFLNSRAMVTLGILSYSLYVWHVLFISNFIGPPLASWPTHDWRVWIFPTLVVSALSFYFLETPFLALRKKYHS